MPAACLMYLNIRNQPVNKSDHLWVVQYIRSDRVKQHDFVNSELKVSIMKEFIIYLPV
jgi:hypothetical protein